MVFYSLYVSSWGFSFNYSIILVMVYNEINVFDCYGNVFSWYINCGICIDIFCFINWLYCLSCSDGVNYIVINEYDFNYLFI